MQEIRQTSRRVETQMREEEMAAWLSRQGKDYNLSIVPEQLGLKEHERGQQLAHGAHRWSLWMGSGETWSSISDGLVDDSQAPQHLIHLLRVMRLTAFVLVVQVTCHVY